MVSAARPPPDGLILFNVGIVVSANVAGDSTPVAVVAAAAAAGVAAALATMLLLLLLLSLLPLLLLLFRLLLLANLRVIVGFSLVVVAVAAVAGFDCSL